MKKVIFMSYGSNTSSWKPSRWVRLNLMMSDMYINFNLNSLTKFTSSRSTKFTIENLLSDDKDHHNQHKNSHKLCTEIGISFWVWQKVNGNWDNNTIWVSQCRESHCTKNATTLFAVFHIYWYKKDLWNCQHNKNWLGSCWFDGGSSNVSKKKKKTCSQIDEWNSWNSTHA